MAVYFSVFLFGEIIEMGRSLKYDERLLLSPWSDLSAEDKSHAIAHACQIAYELTYSQRPPTREMDYYTDVVTQMWLYAKPNETSPEILKWWSTIRNNSTYAYDERVKAFKNAINTLQQSNA